MLRHLATLSLILLLPFWAAGAARAEIVSEPQRTVQLSAEPRDIAVSPDGQRTYVLLRGGLVEVRDAAGTLLGTVQTDADATAVATTGDGSQLYAVTTTGRSLHILNVDLVHQLDLSGSPFRGPAGAPVAIAVYNDFQ